MILEIFSRLLVDPLTEVSPEQDSHGPAHEGFALLLGTPACSHQACLTRAGSPADSPAELGPNRLTFKLPSLPERQAEPAGQKQGSRQQQSNQGSGNQSSPRSGRRGRKGDAAGDKSNPESGKSVADAPRKRGRRAESLQGKAKLADGVSCPPVAELHPDEMRALKQANPRESPDSSRADGLEYA